MRGYSRRELPALHTAAVENGRARVGSKTVVIWSRCAHRRRPSRSRHECPRMEPRSDPADRRRFARANSALTDKPDRGKGTVSFAEMRRGSVGLCVATQIARYVAPDNPLSGWHSQEQAWAQTQGQLAWYRAMEERGELTAITDIATLDAHLARWADRGVVTGYADRLRAEPRRGGLDPHAAAPRAGLMPRACARSVRRTTARASTPRARTRAAGWGRTATSCCARWSGSSIILDATHLCDDSFRDALDHFRGPVWASHSNSRTAGRPQPPVLRRAHPRADRPRRGHRRRLRRLDDRAGLGPRLVDAGSTPA